MIEQGNEYRAKANADRVDHVGGGGGRGRPKQWGIIMTVTTVRRAREVFYTANRSKWYKTINQQKMREWLYYYHKNRVLHEKKKLKYYQMIGCGFYFPPTKNWANVTLNVYCKMHSCPCSIRATVYLETVIMFGCRRYLQFGLRITLRPCECQEL